MFISLSLSSEARCSLASLHLLPKLLRYTFTSLCLWQHDRCQLPRTEHSWRFPMYQTGPMLVILRP